MSKTNQLLKTSLSSIKENKEKQEVKKIKKSLPKRDTRNISGKKAFKLDPFLDLLTMLNTLKLEPQFYATANDQVTRLHSLIETCVQINLILTCKCVVWSRKFGAGMRTISHIASVFLAKHIKEKHFAKRFYSNTTGVIYRPDDMYEILNGFIQYSNGKKLTNSMKKGFKQAIENLSTYHLLKYKSKLIDVINLCRPNPTLSKATVTYNDEVISTLTAIIKNYKVSANTWEVNQVVAGQEVANALKENRISKEEAEQILTQAKADNWKELLDNNQLGILAALRNIRNILSNNPEDSTITKLCKLLSNSELIKKGKIFPYQIDMAQEIVKSTFTNSSSREVLSALSKGYTEAIPNLKEILTGKNLVIVDMSGSMYTKVSTSGFTSKSTCMEKATLIAATIAKAVNADIIRFGSSANFFNYNPNTDVFSLARDMEENLGGTNLSTAFNLITNSGRKYDRIFILSDNEINNGRTYDSYANLVYKIGTPYIYSVDMAAYGTSILKGDHVKFLFGYGFHLFEEIAMTEFNPNNYLDAVKAIRI